MPQPILEKGKGGSELLLESSETIASLSFLLILDIFSILAIHLVFQKINKCQNHQCHQCSEGTKLQEMLGLGASMRPEVGIHFHTIEYII